MNYQKVTSELSNLVQTRYLLASIFPALVGSSLPFWLHPPSFTFKWMNSLEFLIITFLFHLTFLLLNIFFEKKLETQIRQRLLTLSVIFILISCLIGLHLNTQLTFHKGVPSYIFLVYGVATFIVGVLYVVPPFSFNKRIGGEIVIAEGLGMLPLIGAYLVQVGDITRTVYIASLPIIVVTGLWVWIIEIINKDDDEKMGKRNLVLDFGLQFSARLGVVIIIILFYLSILFAFVSSSLSPLFLIIILFSGLMFRIIIISRRDYLIPGHMKKVEKKVMILHLATCLIIIITSLVNYK